VFHLFHLGPITRGRRQAWLVGGVDEFGAYVQPVVEARLDRAVKRMVKGFLSTDVALDPALADFARTLKVPVAARPDDLSSAPAVLAFSAANNHEHLPRGTGIRTFLEACRGYGALAPWDEFDSDQPIRLNVEARRRETTREALVLGAHGGPCGLVLCDRPGDALRCFDALRRGDANVVRKIDAITLAFGPEPAWALEPVRAAFSLPEFPGVYRTRRGHVCPTTETELGTLAVALRAVTLLCSERATAGHPVETHVCIDGDEFRAIAFPPEPRARPRSAPRLAAETVRGPRLLH
jgi:hypothetical protein